MEHTFYQKPRKMSRSELLFFDGRQHFDKFNLVVKNNLSEQTALMKKRDMLDAFRKLDGRLEKSVRLIIGGGAALVVAYDVPISTLDVDGTPDKSSMELVDFKKEVRAVGREMEIPQDWLNDHFSSFLFVLPSDYGQRLKTIYKGRHLEACALGKEDLLIMKCFAGREKDIPHARVLIKKGADLKLVDNRIDELIHKKIPGAEKASNFLSDLCEELGISP